jgi:hypothetical protein
MGSNFELSDLQAELVERNKELLVKEGLVAKESAGKKPSKFHNKTHKFEETTFGSGQEADRAGELMRLQLAGGIIHLRFHSKWPLPGGVVYIDDSDYFIVYPGAKDRPGRIEYCVEDTKGARTRDYINKKKQMKEYYGIEVQEWRP